MPEQYVATDKRTGLEVAVTGQFPAHPQDRIRIARTTNLFTRLTSTILEMGQESERRDAFIAVETQMELAEALIRRDMAEVQRLIQETLAKLGMSPDDMKKLEDELRRHLGSMGLPADQIIPDDPPPPDDRPLDDRDLPPPDGSNK